MDSACLVLFFFYNDSLPEVYRSVSFSPSFNNDLLGRESDRLNGGASRYYTGSTTTRIRRRIATHHTTHTTHTTKNLNNMVLK